MEKNEFDSIEKLCVKIASECQKQTTADANCGTPNATYSDILCEDQYFGIIRIEKSFPSFCEWVIPPVCLESGNIDDKKSLIETTSIS